ncbi:MAG: hypothetical protein HY075_16035, partial [Deltaproteobacteria bacterium]|nr:hypothetical protein [Deltaproteobacteria bacterium]
MIAALLCLVAGLGAGCAKNDRSAGKRSSQDELTAKLNQEPVSATLMATSALGSSCDGNTAA